MSREDIKELIEQNEMISMCSSHFDEESYEMGVNELVDTIEQLIINK